MYITGHTKQREDEQNDTTAIFLFSDFATAIFVCTDFTTHMQVTKSNAKTRRTKRTKCVANWCGRKLLRRKLRK
jgi:hypothetical protein